MFLLSAGCICSTLSVFRLYHWKGTYLLIVVVVGNLKNHCNLTCHNCTYIRCVVKVLAWSNKVTKNLPWKLTQDSPRWQDSSASLLEKIVWTCFSVDLISSFWEIISSFKNFLQCAFFFSLLAFCFISSCFKMPVRYCGLKRSESKSRLMVEQTLSLNSDRAQPPIAFLLAEVVDTLG